MSLRDRIRTAVRYLVIAALVLAVGGIFGGLFVMISGVVPIKASSGHWPITAALLDFAKRRSVATHTIGVTPPPLDDRALVLKGGGHYDFACEPCHGSPVLQQPRIAGAMTPRPPDLRTAALTYDPKELFYIVKHGIKFTGMPAWPAQTRDDEVWAVVAFLRSMPRLDANGYNELAGITQAAPGDKLPLEDLAGESPPVPEVVTENCARCHGIDGRGRGAGAFPRIDGQRLEYLSSSLRAYAQGHRHSGIMEPLSAHLGNDDIRSIAEYYSGLPSNVAAPNASADPGAIERGRRIATDGDPGRLVPACRECHGPGVTRNANYPRLTGQYADYIVQQLRLFRSHGRGGTEYLHIMMKVAGQLTEEQMHDVAQYYASLPDK
jgi:cytochrome c553